MDQVLDVSDLPAPEPLERALDALDALAPGDRLLLRHRREPFPLYDFLRQMGYRWEVTEHGGTWEILIERPADPSPRPGPPLL
jgi:uncharacterized protein (DUF2249 family)